MNKQRIINALKSALVDIRKLKETDKIVALIIQAQTEKGNIRTDLHIIRGKTKDV